MEHDVAIKVEHVSKTFKLPHERNTSIKSAVINFYRRKRTYEVQEALKDVSFEIKKGEFFGIVGRNGSGKSTLLKLLAGIYTPTGGQVHVRGKLIPFIELGVGFNPELSGRENVFLNGALLGFNRKEMEAMYNDIVEFAELRRFMDQRLKNYSSGMQVRLAFSIAIRAKGDILLLDEVLAVGDAAFQQKCFDYFKELKQRRQTVVFVSHDMGTVKRFCTKAVYIKEGKLLHQGTAEEIADIYVEENLQNATASEDELKQVTKEKPALVANTRWLTEGELEFEVRYKSLTDTKMYAGISVMKDGVSIAEITTDLAKPLVRNGTITYTLDTTSLNGGIYHIGVALFKVENRELLVIYPGKKEFLVKGSDVRKGAALKLADTWRYN